MRRAASIVVLLLVVLMSAASAQQSAADALIAAVRLETEPDGLDKPSPWRDYPARPAHEALDADLYAEYRQALKRGDCETPLRIVQSAYLTQYPAIQPAFANRDVVRSWRIGIFRDAYPDAALCAALAGLKAETERLKAQGYRIVPGRSLLAGRQEDLNLVPRDSHIWVIDELARKDYIPAMQAYLRLEDEAYVTFQQMDRLYMLYRLDVLGGSLPDQEDRLQRASQYALPVVIERARCWADKGTQLLLLPIDKCL